MQQRRNWLILLAFLAAIICIPILKPLVFYQTERAAVSDGSLAGIGDALGQSPVLVAFTYNGDCCDSTRDFFDEFNHRVESIARPFGQRLTVVWADASIETESYRTNLEDLAHRYSVMRLPSCLVIAADGEAIAIIEGMPDDDHLHNAIIKAVGGE